MRIVQVKMIPLQLPLVQAFKTAHDTTQGRALTLLELVSQEGLKGYGEIQSFTNLLYAPETQTMSQEALQKLVPHLLALEWNHPSEVADALAKVSSLSFVRAGLEMACWDIYGKKQQKSLAAMLGAHVTEVPVGIALSIGANTETMKRAIDAGYRRIKLKLNAKARLPDLQTLRLAHPDVIFSTDLNNDLLDTEASYVKLAKMQRAGIDLVEEPLQNAPWETYQQLTQQNDFPMISLDESINSADDVKDALKRHVAAAYTLKQGKLGGVTETITAIKAIQTAGQLPWIGGMLSSGLGRIVDIALAATLPQPIFPADISATEHYVKHDLIQETIKFKDGLVQVPQRWGLGVTIDWQAVAAVRVGRAITFR